MSWDNNMGWEAYKKITSQYTSEINNNLPFEKKEAYNSIIKTLNDDKLKISIGGPVQTIFTGLIGLLLLLLRQRKTKRYGLKLFDWILVFLSLFWLRVVFNIIISIFNGIVTGNGQYFSGDEYLISKGFGLPVGILSIIIGLIGFSVSIFIVFKIIPKKIRLSFISAGFIGGITGFLLWIKIIGPIILP